MTTPSEFCPYDRQQMFDLIKLVEEDYSFACSQFSEEGLAAAVFNAAREFAKALPLASKKVTVYDVEASWRQNQADAFIPSVYRYLTRESAEHMMRTLENEGGGKFSHVKIVEHEIEMPNE